jgi:hypothetical protein
MRVSAAVAFLRPGKHTCLYALSTDYGAAPSVAYRLRQVRSLVTHAATRFQGRERLSGHLFILRSKVRFSGSPIWKWTFRFGQNRADKSTAPERPLSGIRNSAWNGRQWVESGRQGVRLQSACWECWTGVLLGLLARLTGRPAPCSKPSSQGEGV